MRRKSGKLAEDTSNQVRVIVHESLYSRLMAYCRAKDTTRSIVTRKALHQFLTKEGFINNDDG